MNSNQPQRCIKCHKLPEDILMLACSHDLCLDCAADRLAFELKKKKPANSIVCEICYERTPLDPESISELEKLIVPPKQTPVKSYVEPNKGELNDKFERVAAKVGQQDRIKQKTYERQPIREYNYGNIQANNNSTTSSRLAVSGISNRKSCGEHPDEDILYFCFDCKCQCICPECVIHGRHKDHQVKTIRKAHPTIKNELSSTLDKIQGLIQTLLIRKSQVDKNIRTLSDHNNQAKAQIQNAFNEVRNVLAIKQKQILSKCDITLQQSLEELERGVKNVIKKIQDLRNSSANINQHMKKDEMVMLNFYAKKWKQLGQQARDPQIAIPQITSASTEKTLSSILEATDYVGRIKLGAKI